MTEQNCSCIKCWSLNVYMVAIYECGITMRHRIAGDIVSDFEMKQFDSFVVFFSDKNKEIYHQTPICLQYI